MGSFTPGVSADPVQRITLVRRNYNNWVASETLEDYALRFAPQRFRKWSEWRVANTAFGAARYGFDMDLRTGAVLSLDPGAFPGVTHYLGGGIQDPWL